MVAARALLLLALPLAPADRLTAQEGCSLSPTFQQLRDQLPDIVGDCLAPEALNPATGNVEQPTTGGLLVRRAAVGRLWARSRFSFSQRRPRSREFTSVYLPGNEGDG
jgi:hypothetical protein